MPDKKQLYRTLCHEQTGIPLFSRDWWLDTVCGGAKNWDVAIVERDAKVIASMPYFLKKKAGFSLLTHPPLTQTLGPWLSPSKAKYAKALAEQKDLMQALIDQLPYFDFFSQNWNYKNTNWLPFYWRGFKQTTRYTYIIQNLTDEKLIWTGLQANIRTDIRKAENRFKLTVRDDLGLEVFLRLNRLTFERQGQMMPYSEEFVHRLDASCGERNCRKILIAVDSEGRPHAGVYIVWDENSAYYIMGGGDPELRNSGATSLCMWHAIKYAITVTRQFDFEGSMMEPVERFFRGFGAKQTQYSMISKTPSRILRLHEAFKNLKKEL